ncbi:MAG: lysophospholipid acyltransferase family protein [Vicinamibacteria bacterium]|nr:lysophospholipid acyltransferase family protein [Vicinamibacteria bacterium]MBP9946821.1 lysophospholipid acyltransferase family protein [Vicinamibacteria bacterium]
MTLDATRIPEPRRASPFVALVGRVVFRLLGWKCKGETPTANKYVILAAPHTSNWDGFFLILAAAMLKLDFSFFGKDTLFKGPLGWFLRSVGGIPLDRSRHQSFVAQAVSWFESHERFALGVAPEGTRQFTPGWRRGFYYIALQAKVPIVMGYIDYAKKEGGILPEVLIPSGDIERDFETLARLYGPLTARHPDRKGPIVPLK